IIHIMRTGFAWHTFEHTVFRVLVMLPIDKGGVMHSTAQHEGLAIVVTQISGHLQVVVIRFVRVIVGQGSTAAQPGRFRNLDRVFGTATKHRSIEGAGQDVPGHDTFTHNVQVGGAVVWRTALRYARIEELAQFKLQLVAFANRLAGTAVMGSFFVVVQVINHHHGAVITVLSHGADAAIEPAVFRFGIIQAPLGSDVHADAGGVIRELGFDDLNRGGAMLPVEAQPVIVGLEVAFFRVTVTGAVGDAGNQLVALLHLNGRLQRGGTVIQRHNVTQRYAAG